MVPFILNNEAIETDLPPGLTVLDFIRYHQHLMGTKIGCREGDCGACTILVGTLTGDQVVYRSMTACLMPLANARGKHLVTVEGINRPKGLTPVQQAMVAENGTQCGFCTVGFVVSLTGLCLEKKAPLPEQAISAIDGNICRCTGYKSIERAADRLTQLLNSRKNEAALDFAIRNNIVPAYFSTIKIRLQELQRQAKVEPSTKLPADKAVFISGGTDLFVQRPEEMVHAIPSLLFDHSGLRGIQMVNGFIEIGASVTVSDLMESPLMQGIFPNLHKQLKLVSSTPIRNMATLAGNLVNASPIGDLSIWLLALNATVLLRNGASRELRLRDFYLAYKSLDKKADEVLEKIRFPLPAGAFYFNFEKVSKRTCLDIASVNSAISLRIENDVISEAHVSAGGVAPIPLYLKNTSAYLAGKSLSSKDGSSISWLPEANEILQSEISPISDVRGSAAYKSLLLRQLFQAHFIEMFAMHEKH